MTSQSLDTTAIHADHELGHKEWNVAPNLSVSTTFRYPSPAELDAVGGTFGAPFDFLDREHQLYSRLSQPTSDRTEKVLTDVIGQPTLLYPSGLAAAYAILLLVQPDVVAVSKAYYGCIECINVYKRSKGDVTVITLEDEFPTDKKLLVWLETPLNPTGEALSIEYYAKKAHAAGGKLAIDSTFGPPPLQDPFKWGADVVMHSATKYFSGHTDSLGGTVSVRTKEELQELWHNRTYTGAAPGSLEAFLILRSLRTLPLRVQRQSETATQLAQWLKTCNHPALGSVSHVSLQKDTADLLGPGKQMEIGSACFAFTLTKDEYAKAIPHLTKLFIPATSLGGVESLIEQRVRSDKRSDPKLLRVSIGLEAFEDLRDDLLQAFDQVVQNS